MTEPVQQQQQPPLNEQQQLLQQYQQRQQQAELQAAAQQQQQQQTNSDDMQLDDDSNNPNAHLPPNLNPNISAEERRVQDNNTNTSGATDISPNNDTSNSLNPSPSSSPDPINPAAPASSPTPAVAPVPVKPVAREAPTIYRMACTRCASLIQFPFPSRLVHCCVCNQMNAVNLSTAVNHEQNPLPAKELKDQAAQWSTNQVLVFLKSLRLEHLAGIFEINQIDGATLLELTYYDIRDILRIQSRTDIENVLNCISILRGGAPVPTPYDLVKQAEAEAPAAATGAAAETAAAKPPQPPQPTTAAAVTTKKERVSGTFAFPTEATATATVPTTASLAAASNQSTAGSSTPSVTSSAGELNDTSSTLQPMTDVPSSSSGGGPVASIAVAAESSPATSPTPSQATLPSQHQVVTSPSQGSVTSLAHFTPMSGSAEGTTEHARHVLEQQHLQLQQQQGQNSNGSAPMQM